MASSNWNTKKFMSEQRQRAIDKLELIGEVVEGQAKQLCPVGDTGYLKGSITHQVNEEELSVRIGTNVEYAPWIEFGTGEFAENGDGRKGGWVYYNALLDQYFFTDGMDPQPFLRPGLTLSESAIKEILNA